MGHVPVVRVESRPLSTPSTVAQEVMREYWDSPRSSPQKMWDSWQDKHRVQILTALACVPPFQRVYELGAGAGPNLRLIKHHRPQATVGGSDVNPGLAAWAAEHLGASIDPVGFPHAPGPEWDVAFTCYALAYATEDEARETLQRIQARSLILFEPCAWVAPFGAPGTYQTGSAMPLNAHAYLDLLRETDWRLMWRWPLFPDHQGLNTVVIAER